MHEEKTYSNPEFSDMVQSEKHYLYNDGGNSEIIINADIGQDTRYRCHVQLLNDIICGVNFQLKFLGKI